MQRYLVITTPRVSSFDAIEREKARLEAYLYSTSKLTHYSIAKAEVGGGFTATALVVVSTESVERLRFLADYQADRLRSGSFLVENYVGDEQAAHKRVVGDWALNTEPAPAEPKPLTPALALAYAIDALGLEEVRYAMALDSDFVNDCTTITDPVTGQERPYTEDDLNEEIRHHDAVIDLLRQLYDVVKETA